MIDLIFTPRTTIEANEFEGRLDKTNLKGEWNMRIGGFVFETTEDEVDELEEEIKETISQGINGFFEVHFK